ncbi:hypothetical protein C8R47DRAFT_571482 [Mycena vitilis]|nr:hypothetical protein C8R47DRAFT_571482 [Mycena vitilis]
MCFERVRLRACTDTSALFSRRARAAVARVAFGGRNEGRRGSGALRSTVPVTTLHDVPHSCCWCSYMRRCTYMRRARIWWEAPRVAAARRTGTDAPPRPFTPLMRLSSQRARRPLAVRVVRLFESWFLCGCRKGGARRRRAVRAQVLTHRDVPPSAFRLLVRARSGMTLRQRAVLVPAQRESVTPVARHACTSHESSRAVRAFAPGARMGLVIGGRNEGGREGVPPEVLVLLVRASLDRSHSAVRGCQGGKQITATGFNVRTCYILHPFYPTITTSISVPSSSRCILPPSPRRRAPSDHSLSFLILPRGG